ncbi:DUF3073 domain-containing protein [Actinopolymorpha rutila]|uniref:DUF3073 domain-containing protein n=1 Tax=Actinopolymorpha rutila TaxID=446787 RepID=A0A852ZKJ4_9ACTN|nr:DUF3073 domain-containing protein [Actinopolymorpha rutila]NYH93514.1 hypothetical protein [Actinopolymorpha rutila]
MGRGRAKAKQTKVARELKYRTHDTDLEALQRELSSREDANGNVRGEQDDPDEPDEDGADEDHRIARRR